MAIIPGEEQFPTITAAGTNVDCRTVWERGRCKVPGRCPDSSVSLLLRTCSLPAYPCRFRGSRQRLGINSCFLPTWGWTQGSLMYQ